MYQVEKRNGEIADFEAEKIENAVKKAMRAFLPPSMCRTSLRSRRLRRL